MSTSDGNALGMSTGSLLSVAPKSARREQEPPARSLLTVAEDDARDIHKRRREARQAASSAPARPVEPAPEPDSVAARLRARAAALRDGWGPKSSRTKQAPTPSAPTQAPAAVATPFDAPGADDDAGEPNPYWQPLIDPVRVISGIFQSKRLILATTILGGALGVAIALSVPKKYDSTTELLVDPRNLNIVDREITQAGLPSDATLAIVENQVRVMESGIVIDKVVERLNLTADPEFNGEASGFSVIGLVDDIRALLFSDDLGDPIKRRQAVAVNNLYKALTIERGSKTFVISISAETKEPDKSALIANTVADVFLDTYGELQSGTAGRATQELTGRLDELRRAVEAAERKVEAFKAENEIIDPQGRLISDDEIVKLNEQLAVARARTIELNARADSARGVDIGDVLNGTLPEQAASGLITELRSQYASLMQESDRLAVRLGPRHPQRQAVEAQLAGAREQIANELRRLNAGIQVDLKRAVQLEQDLAARLAQLKVQKGSLSEELVTLRELERDATSKRSVYESYLLRARETGEQQSLNTANVSVISKANPPLRPSGPSRSMIAIAFTVLGFAAGVGLGGVRGAIDSFQDNSRRGRRPAPRTLGVPNPTKPAPPSGRAAVPPTTQENDMMHLVKSDRRDRQDDAPAHPQHYPQGREQQAWQPPHPRATSGLMMHPEPMHPAYGYGQPGPYPADPRTMAGQPTQGQAWQHPHAAYPQSVPPQAYPQAMAPHFHPYAPPPQQWGNPAAQQQQPFVDPYLYHPHPAPQQHQPSAPHLSVVQASEPEPERTPIDEIRDSLREVREAIRELSENRKRRYF